MRANTCWQISDDVAPLKVWSVEEPNDVSLSQAVELGLISKYLLDQTFLVDFERVRVNGQRGYMKVHTLAHSIFG